MMGVEDSFCGNRFGLGAQDVYGVSAGYEHDWLPELYISVVAYSPTKNYSISSSTVFGSPPRITNTSTECATSAV